MDRVKNRDTITRTLSERLEPMDRFIYGFADLTGLADSCWGEFTYAISIGYKLDENIVDPIINGPNLEYYKHYGEVNRLLADIAGSISTDLARTGIRSIALEPTVTTEQLDSLYSSDLRTRFSHKMAATRAGLGWIGKTALLVTGEFGPRLRLVTILTDTPVEITRAPIDKSRCGTCNVCVEKCPAKAANGLLWDIGVDRDEFFDPFSCRETCRRFGEEVLKVNVRVCGMCVAVCPIGRNN